MLSADGCCLCLLFAVKKESKIPIVKTNAEKTDKKDKESLKVLSDKTPPPQIKHQIIIILFFNFIVNEVV